MGRPPPTAFALGGLLAVVMLGCLGAQTPADMQTLEELRALEEARARTEREALQEEQDALADRLLPGDPAPDLITREWVTGVPISRLDPGATYVLAFFKTACTACKESIPELDRVQELFRGGGLQVIAISLWDDAERVARYLEQWPQGLSFSIATGATSEMQSAWMSAAFIDDAPCAFVVDPSGNVAWFGDPRHDLEQVVGAVITGTWDTDAERDRMRDRFLLELRVGKLLRRAGRATLDRQPARAVEILDEVLALDPGQLGVHAAQRFSLTLIDLADPEAAYEFLRANWRETLGNRPRALGAVSRTILVDRRVKTRDPELATLLLQRACELTHEFDAPLLDLLAAAHHAAGDLDAAIVAQEKALHQAPPPLRRRFAERLQLYRSEKE